MPKGRPRGTTKRKSLEELQLFLLGSAPDDSIETRRSRLMALIKLFDSYIRESENQINDLREFLEVEERSIPDGFVKVPPSLIPFVLDPTLNTTK
jgi:hypothetical protein